MEIQYRLASIDEMEILTKIRIDFLREANNINETEEKDLYETNKEYFINAFSNGIFAAWVAIENDKIIATSGISFFELPPNKKCPNGKIADINNMFTYPEYRNKGIASTLFDLSVKEAIKRGCKKIMLTATDMGRPLYEKYGFITTNNHMIYFT